MKTLSFYLALCCVNCCFGQYNLVPNSSFEEVPSCPNYCIEINCAPPWENANEFGTSDIFNFLSDGLKIVPLITFCIFFKFYCYLIKN